MNKYKIRFSSTIEPRFDQRFLFKSSVLLLQSAFLKHLWFIQTWNREFLWVLANLFFIKSMSVCRDKIKFKKSRIVTVILVKLLFLRQHNDIRRTSFGCPGRTCRISCISILILMSSQDILRISAWEPYISL